jgi:UDP-N-acetylmuramate dehydrogenase
LDENKFYVEAGAMLPYMSRLLSGKGFEGYSGLVGIPGTIGGAIFMNASAYDCQISDNLKYATCLNDSNEICELSKDELSFNWRSSAFQNKFKKYVILSAVFQLKSGNLKSIQEHIEKVSIHRKKYQENDYPNLGSTFATKDIYGDLSKYFLLYKLVHILVKIITKIYLGDQNIFYAKWMNILSQLYFNLKPTATFDFSDHTFNCLINKGGAEANELIEFIRRIQKATKYKIPLEIEIFPDNYRNGI